MHLHAYIYIYTHNMSYTFVCNIVYIYIYAGLCINKRMLFGPCNVNREKPSTPLSKSTRAFRSLTCGP